MHTADTLYLYAGNDGYSKNLDLERLKKAVLQEGSEAFNFCAYDASEKGDINTLLGHLRSAPAFGGRKLAVLRNADRIDARSRDIILAYVKSQPEWACLVLETSKESLPAEWNRQIAGRVKRVFFGEPAGARLDQWILSRFKERGKSVSPGALELLKEARGGDLQGLTQEIEKLAAFAGKRPRIERDDVDALVAGSAARNVFDFTGALKRKNGALALSLVGALMKTGKRVPELLGLIGWELRRSGSGSELALLLEADKDIKTGRLAPDLALEVLIIKITGCMCKKVAGRP